MDLKQRIKNLFPERYHARGDYFYAACTSLLYMGSRYACPICGGRFRTFLPREENNRCPRCRSYARHRLLLLYLQRETEVYSAPLKLLHLAPTPYVKARLKSRKNLTYLSGDLQSVYADKHFDLTKSPLPDNEYDVILCNHVLEHIPDDRAAMRELFRMLKPGGFAMLMVPLSEEEKTIEDPSVQDPKERERLFGQHDHVRFYGRDYYDRLRETGFVVTEGRFAQTLSEREADYYRIDREEVMPLGHKPNE